MIRLERDPSFWQAIADHPEVKPHMGGAVDMSELLKSGSVVPIASKHGGFLFVNVRPNVFELHTLYTPEGWGKEVALAARLAFQRVFHHAAMVTTYEVEGNHHSRPPKSHGWVSVGGFTPNSVGSIRLWILTVEAWTASPVFKKMVN